MAWDKRWMRNSFDRAAPDYDRLAGLQRQVGEQLLSWLPALGPEGWLVDLGAGTGWCSRHLKQRYPGRPLLQLDIAEGMLHQSRHRFSPPATYWVAGDVEHLPLANGRATLVVSNLALQWCLEPERVMEQVFHLLCPGGTFIFSTFGVGTLEELRRAWQKLDGYSHVIPFVEAAQLTNGLELAGFSQIQMVTEKIRLCYPSLSSMLRELKGIGARNATLNRPRHLLGRGRFLRLESVYEKSELGLPASFVACFGKAVK